MMKIDMALVWTIIMVLAGMAVGVWFMLKFFQSGPMKIEYDAAKQGAGFILAGGLKTVRFF